MLFCVLHLGLSDKIVSNMNKTVISRSWPHPPFKPSLKPSKIDPRSSKMRPRGAQEAQEAPKRRPRPPKGRPRGTQEAPKSAQERPRGAQERPRRVQEAPIPSQNRAQGAPKARIGRFGGFLEGCVRDAWFCRRFLNFQKDFKIRST